MPQASTPIVFVIDEDRSVRESMEQLVRKAGLQAETFSTAYDFLARPRSNVPCCLVVNLTLPGLNGLQLQERIAGGRRQLPIIFLADQCDVCTAVKAMKGGALEILTKPYDHEALLNAIRYAIKRSEITLGRESELQALRSGYGTLTPREREVMSLVVSGLLNKQVGGELGISEITVKIHRGNVMRKMNAASFAALVNMATRLHIYQPTLAGAA
jgi:FixJ family two-component response regulator